MKAMEKKKCKIDCKRQKAAGNLRVAAETCSLTRRPPLRADCTGGNLKGTARVHLQVAARTFGRAESSKEGGTSSPSSSSANVTILG
jgi:hypothetical protein